MHVSDNNGGIIPVYFTDVLIHSSLSHHLTVCGFILTICIQGFSSAYLKDINPPFRHTPSQNAPPCFNSLK